MENILITICGRGGSKGIPGKNIRPLAGKPLIAYTIGVAQTLARSWNCVISVSSDSEEIIGVAGTYGVPVAYRRPSELATDTAGKIPVIGDLLSFEEKRRQLTFDYIVDLDITSPMRSLEDLEEGLKTIMQDRNALNLFSVSPAHRNPYFNMVEETGNGYYGLCKKGAFRTRQEAPKVYDMNASFYIYRRTFFERGEKSAITDRSLVYVMPHACFDLDEPMDFEFMEFLISNGRLSFQI